MRVRRIVAVAGVAIVTAELALSAGLYWAMRQPPDVFGHFMARLPMAAMMVLPFEPLWMRARGGSVNPGDPAPDFRLPALDRRSTVQLSSFRGARPVVLVFGSYT